jgi:6-phosphogluconolactonase
MIRIFPDYEALSRAAAEHTVRVGREAIAQRGLFHLALSGGSTPRGAYGILAEKLGAGPPLRRATHFYWGDERCVPAEHPQSNYAMARACLLDRVQVLPEQVHRIHADDPDPQGAAERYAAGFPAQADLLLLGIGEDGHTASLFPGSGGLARGNARFAFVEAPVEPRGRITITPAGIAAARHVLVLVSGAGKAEALRRVFAPQGDVQQTPARLVRGATWFVDRRAAALLEPGHNVP